MKTITVEKTLYDFEEVREKALEKNRYCLVDDYSYWYDEIFNNQKEELEKIGFMNPDIQFSGFCSQGDGACFDADIDVEKILDYLLENKKLNEDEVKSLKNLIDYFEVKIEKNHWANQYSHERTRYINVEDFYIENEEDKPLTQKLEKVIEQLRIEKSKEIYNQLEEEYDCLTSDDCLESWLGDDAYWFNEDGTIYESK